LTIHAATASATASALPGGIAVGTRLLLHWSEIAIEHEAASHAARREIEASRKERLAAGQGLELERELRPSMVAVAAASHALDALYGETFKLALPPELVAARQDPSRRRPPRPCQINEALKHGFLFHPADRFQKRLDVLFSQLRNPAVHPKTSLNPPSRHPLGVDVAREYDLYRCETATDAVNLLIEVLETCAAKPKPALWAWSEELRPSFERLTAKRTGQNHH
jgi:hypothetical protein